MANGFVCQPDADFRLGDFLKKNLTTETWEEFRAAIAFVKFSGVKHIAGNLATFASTKKVRISAGIDCGGSSQQGIAGLLAAVQPSGEVWIFHNAGTPTFHPKIYLFKNATAAELIVGSGNLTEGGLFTNYEAGIHASLDLSKPAHAKFLQDLETALDDWSTAKPGLCAHLTEAFLKKLIAQGLLPPEKFSFPTSASGKSTSAASTEAPLFTSHKIKSAPKVVPLSKPGAPAGLPKPSPFLAKILKSGQTPHGFVMTLQQTDAGKGGPGKKRRSPEIFIPLAARDLDPAFWGWPAKFKEDPKKKKKMDRTKVKIRIGTETPDVTMMTWPDRSDFRLRSEVLRSAGKVGDILRLEVSPPGSGFDYYAEIIPQGTTQYPYFLSLCNTAARKPSKKRFGYF